MRVSFRRLTLRRFVQVLAVIVIVTFAIKESRILWTIKELDWFRNLSWRIHVSPEVYTIQNMMSILIGIVVLALLSRRDSSKVLSPEKHAPKTGVTSQSRHEKRRGRIESPESPFEMVNRKWKLVYPNPKLEKEEE